MVVESPAAVDVANARPIFIVGCGRSGTTLLRLMLDSHPAIAAGEETKFLTDLEPILGEHWRLLQTYGFNRAWWLERMRAFYGGFMAEYAQRKGKRRWAEKTPGYTFHLDLVDELFPNAQYVHLIRDGRDVVASFRERWGYKAGLRAANSVWRESILRARAYGEHLPPDRYHELRYEALVADPERELRSLIAFLGEEWDDAVLRYDELPHDTTERYAQYSAKRRAESGGGKGVYTSSSGRGRRKLDPALRAVLMRSSGKLLADLGYTD
jgi:hypothetical protein